MFLLFFVNNNINNEDNTWGGSHPNDKVLQSFMAVLIYYNYCRFIYVIFFNNEKLHPHLFYTNLVCFKNKEINVIF